MVDHESVFGSGYFFNLFFLHIVDLDLVVSAAPGVPGGQGGGLFKEAVGNQIDGLSLGFDDHVGAWDSFGMEP